MEMKLNGGPGDFSSFDSFASYGLMPSGSWWNRGSEAGQDERDYAPLGSSHSARLNGFFQLGKKKWHWYPALPAVLLEQSRMRIAFNGFPPSPLQTCPASISTPKIDSRCFLQLPDSLLLSPLPELTFHPLMQVSLSKQYLVVPQLPKHLNF